MNLRELISAVQERTHLGEAEIQAIVRAAWPVHVEFTHTQAALVVNSILRRGAALRNYSVVPTESGHPRTITDEQLWGKE